jgi:hypothetical protein
LRRRPGLARGSGRSALLRGGQGAAGGGVIRGMDCLGEEFGSRDSNEILESVGQYLQRR